MYYTYILRSISSPKEIYKGFTTLNTYKRLEVHNAGSVPHTSKFTPWELIWFAGFEHEKQARAFEKYLKSASGIAFLRKRLIQR